MTAQAQFADVVPLKPGTITLQDRSVISIIDNLRWDYQSRYNVKPQFLVVGGNFYKRLVSELFTYGLHMDGKRITEVRGLTLVKVKRDVLEVGE